MGVVVLVVVEVRMAKSGKVKLGEAVLCSATALNGTIEPARFTKCSTYSCGAKTATRSGDLIAR